MAWHGLAGRARCSIGDAAAAALLSLSFSLSLTTQEKWGAPSDVGMVSHSRSRSCSAASTGRQALLSNSCKSHAQRLSQRQTGGQADPNPRHQKEMGRITARVKCTGRACAWAGVSDLARPPRAAGVGGEYVALECVVHHQPLTIVKLSCPTSRFSLCANGSACACACCRKPGHVPACRQRPQRLHHSANLCRCRHAQVARLENLLDPVAAAR